MRGDGALAGSAVPALLACRKRGMGARTILPRAHVGAITRARHVDQFFIAWPPQSKAQTMTARMRYGCSNRILLTAINDVDHTWSRPDEYEQQ